MNSKTWTKEHRKSTKDNRLSRVMKCFSSKDQSKAVAGDETFSLHESLPAKLYSLSGYSAQTSNGYQKPADTLNLEEVELSLRENSYINYEEARALLGRYEYQKGNIEAALHVFEGVDIATMIPKIKQSLARKRSRRKKCFQRDATPPMSLPAVSLLLEAILLKAKSLQCLGRFKDAALSCKVILDIVESLPGGLPENLGAVCKLQETLTKAVELLPELWKLADFPRKAVRSYRRALLHHWNLGDETMAKIQKEFAMLLLYSGDEAGPPSPRFQINSSFVPRNNAEEAILLLMILIKNASLNTISWDSSILDHLSFALSVVSGDLRVLANQVEELHPGTMDQKEMYYTLGLCYYAAGEKLTALDLLRKLLNENADPNFVPALLMAAKICGEVPELAEEGVCFARRAVRGTDKGCHEMSSVANCLLGISLSEHSRSAAADSERLMFQSESLQALETARRMTRLTDPTIVYHLSLENAEQGKMDSALNYAEQLLNLDVGRDIKGWLLLARILSAQKRYADAETIINTALDQTGKWDQGELLRTKAKLQIAQGLLNDAIRTYIQLIAVFQVQSKSFGSEKPYLQGTGNSDRNLEVEAWHVLARVYINLSRWHDAEICLSKSKAIEPHCASRCHASGMLCESKGLHKEALEAFLTALDIQPTHVPSLISTALVLQRLGGSQSSAVARSFLMDALRVDRMNPSVWHNLGVLYKEEGCSSTSLIEAAECFQTAALLEECAPIEPFR